jgi:hypothetical protein
MLLKKFLDKLITSNAYKTQVYVKPGAVSRRLDKGEKLCIQLPLPGRVARSNHRAREGSRAGGKRTNVDVDVVEDYGGEDGEEEDQRNAPEPSSAKRRRRSSNGQHHASSSSVPAAPLEMDLDSDVEGNSDGDLEYESEDMEWKSNLRGAPAVTHRTLRNKSGAERKTGVASRPPGASDANDLPIYDNEVIDISSE